MNDRAHFLRGLQAHLKERKAPLALPEHLHEDDYVYDSYLRENIEFSVGCKETGFTVRFLLRGRAKKNLGIVYDQLDKCLRPTLKTPDFLHKTWPEGTDRATVIIDCSKRNLSNSDTWPQHYDHIGTYLDVFWRYFVNNRKAFASGKSPTL